MSLIVRVVQNGCPNKARAEDLWGCSKRSSGKAATRSARRRTRSLTFADGRELVSAQCPRGEEYCGMYVEPRSEVRT